jgi:hypothetical protein
MVWIYHEAKSGVLQALGFPKISSPKILDFLFAIQKSLSTIRPLLPLKCRVLRRSINTYQQNLNLSGDPVPLNRLAWIYKFNLQSDFISKKPFFRSATCPGFRWPLRAGLVHQVLQAYFYFWKAIQMNFVYNKGRTTEMFLNSTFRRADVLHPTLFEFEPLCIEPLYMRRRSKLFWHPYCTQCRNQLLSVTIPGPKKV